jgi:hypothetical protein
MALEVRSFDSPDETRPFVDKGAADPFRRHRASATLGMLPIPFGSIRQRGLTEGPKPHRERNSDPGMLPPGIRQHPGRLRSWPTSDAAARGGEDRWGC